MYSTLTNYEKAEFDKFISHFTVIGTCGEEIRVKCPICEHDKLYITTGIHRNGNTQVLIDCKHNCDYKDILSSVGLEPKDLFFNKYPKRDECAVKREHIYTDEDGNPVAKKVIWKYHTDYCTSKGKRFSPGDKQCMWFKYDSENNCFFEKSGLSGLKVPLYHLHKLREADTVIIAEGEKDTETLEAMGYTATTSPNGAGSNWKKEYNTFLKGKKCIILADNDEAGEKYAKKAAASLTEDGIAAYIIKTKKICPDIENKDDITDIFEKYGEAKASEMLQNAINAAKKYKPASNSKHNKSSIGKSITSVSCDDRYNHLVVLDPNNYCYNERTMSELFGKLFYDILRYNTDEKSWYYYDGTRWISDSCSVHACLCAKELYDMLRKYSSSIGDMDKRESFIKCIKSYGTKTKRDTLIKDSIDQMHVKSSVFDCSTNLFNCKNGTLELDTLLFREHRNTDMITKMSNVMYDEHARSELWETTFDQIMSSDADKATFLQKAFGYSLTGEAKEECLFILYGPTSRNGKSTIVNTISNVLGDYAANASPETIALSKKNSHGTSEDVARLKGIRYLTISEPPENLELDSALLKDLTGRDKITARRLYENSIEFFPQFSIFINTNYLPQISDLLLFESDRIHVIPFNRKFTPMERNKELKSKLSADNVISGIFNWLIAGLKLYRVEGLKQPDSVRKATESYGIESDIISRFFEECYIPDPTGQIKGSEVFDLFKKWCADSAIIPLGKHSFNKRLRHDKIMIECATIASSTQRNVVCGYRLKPELCSL